MPVMEGFRLFKMCLHIKDSFSLNLVVCLSINNRV